MGPTPTADTEAATGPTAEATFESAERRLFERLGVEVRTRFVDLDDPPVRVRVLEAGSRDVEEPPVLFVHGAMGFAGMFATLLPRFEDARVLAIDRPGWGGSGDFAYTVANHRPTVVGVLGGVLDALAVDRVDLVGHSTGGFWSIVFALEQPERVRRLVLLGGVPTFPGTRPPLPARLLAVPVLNRLLLSRGEPSAAAEIERLRIVGESETARRYPALIDARVAHDRDPRWIDSAITEVRSLGSVGGWREAVRLRAGELCDLRQPTTFVWGTRDLLGSPDAVREPVAAIPDARLETLDAGHVPWIGRPATCARFVRETRAPDRTRRAPRSR